MMREVIFIDSIGGREYLQLQKSLFQKGLMCCPNCGSLTPIKNIMDYEIDDLMLRGYFGICSEKCNKEFWFLGGNRNAK